MNKWVAMLILLICLSSCLIYVNVEPARATNYSVTLYEKCADNSDNGFGDRDFDETAPSVNGKSNGWTTSGPMIAGPEPTGTWKPHHNVTWPLENVTSLPAQNVTIKVRWYWSGSTSTGYTYIGANLSIFNYEGSIRRHVFGWGQFGKSKTNAQGTQTSTMTIEIESEYSVVNSSDWLTLEFYVRDTNTVAGYNYIIFDDKDVSDSLNTQIYQLSYTQGPPDKYYFNFNHTDLDGNPVDPRVSWQLHNSSGQVSYTKGQATLTSGTYTLKTYRHGILINETSLDTSIQGNSTVDISLPMKAHTHTSNGYISSNTTISSITIISQTSTNLTFTITGSTPCLLMIDVGGQPTNVTKDDLPVSYSYYTSPSKHVRISCSSLSSFSLTWDQPPEQDQGEIPPSGVSGQNSWHKKLWVTVTYNGEKLHLANVSVTGTVTIWTLTNIFGEAKFRVPKGKYIIRAEHPDYGFAEREITVEDHVEIEIDIAKGSPLNVFPSFDFGDFELGVLVLPVAVFVIYAFTLALRKPKRKYRYSYLR